MIVPETIIRFKFNHSRRDIGESVKFEIARDRLAKFKAGFIDCLDGLRACHVPHAEAVPLIRAVLRLVPSQRVKPDIRDAKDWKLLDVQLTDMSARYSDELGENAYAAFNAITEFASHPPDNRCVHRDRHSLQRLAGSWLTSFNAACRKPGFTISGHLEQLEADRAKAAEMVPA